MNLVDDEDIGRYEVGIVRCDDKLTLGATNDLTIAENIYNDAIALFDIHINSNVVIYIYDFERNTNIEYYDSAIENS